MSAATGKCCGVFCEKIIFFENFGKKDLRKGEKCGMVNKFQEIMKIIYQLKYKKYGRFKRFCCS